MIKRICLFLIVCIVFSFYAMPVVSHSEEIENTNNYESSLSLNLMNPDEFCVELEEEGINAENSDEYDICLLIEAKEDPNVDLENLRASNIVANNDEIDEALLQHRRMVKDYYSYHNQSVVDELGLNECNYQISFYAPYIEVVFDDVAEYALYEEFIITEATYNQNIVVSLSNFAVLEQCLDEATINSTSSTIYPFDDALIDIGVADFGYTGAGINVGVIEKGHPDSTINLKEGLYTFLGDNQTPHCTSVTSIIGGLTGIAEDVHFFCLSRGKKFTDDCNILIGEHNVDIINMSNTIYICGYYTKCDAYIDQIICNSGCTFVKSAGNISSSPDSLICAPGCALNAITVGSIDVNQNISNFSCWVTTDDFLLKPDVVAPGGRISGIENIGTINGTSFSTPMVTGIIALLMEEFPILRTNPALVKSILHLGAEKLPSQTDYFDQQAGFGLINYQNMRNSMLNSEYVSFIIPSTGSAGDTVLSHTITIPRWNQININANSIINSSVTQADSTPITPTYTNYTIKLYDVVTSALVASSNINSSVDYLTYINGSLDNTIFRIEIVLEGDNSSGENENGYFAYEFIPHSFSYGLEQNTVNHHIAYCECGEYILQDHNYVEFIKTSESGHTAICECGYEAENSPHFAYSYTYSIRDFSNHSVYCACGHFIGVELHRCITVGNRTYCTICGYERTIDGPIIMGKKEEEEIE